MKYTVFFSFLFLFFTIYGQKSDEKAIKILNNFNTKFIKSKGTKISFTLSIFSKENKVLGDKKLTLCLKNKWYNLKEGKSEIICDGSNVYNYDGISTITKVAVNEVDQALSPQNIFAGNYEKEFYINLKNSNSTQQYLIALTPKDPRKNIELLEIYLNKTTGLMEKAKFTDKSKNYTLLNIKNIAFNVVLNDNLFKFIKSNYPADVEIFD